MYTKASLVQVLCCVSCDGDGGGIGDLKSAVPFPLDFQLESDPGVLQMPA